MESGIVRLINLSRDSTPIFSNIIFSSFLETELCLVENWSELNEILDMKLLKKYIRKCIHKVEK